MLGCVFAISTKVWVFILSSIEPVKIEQNIMTFLFSCIMCILALSWLLSTIFCNLSHCVLVPLLSTDLTQKDPP